MKFVDIFDPPLGILFAVHYENEELDAFAQLFEDWSNPEYLYDFFTENHEDLKNGYYAYELEAAVLETRQEAVALRDFILQEKDKRQLTQENVFRTFFKELSPNEYSVQNIPKQKAYGTKHHSWLRIYALKVDDCYLITGGAIKLTKTMMERKHTSKELTKLEQVRAKLIHLGIFDAEGLTD